MNINFSERKQQMQLNRRFQDIFKWEKYLEQAYPDWWTSIYVYMWPVRIVYYNNDNTIVSFHFHIYRYTKMESIMKRLHSLLQAQFRSVCACFGHDIAMIIYDYMPDLFDPKNNFLYYHSRPLDINDPNGTKLHRVCLNNTTTLNELSCATRNDPIKSRYTNLRMRATPTKKPQHVL